MFKRPDVENGAEILVVLREAMAGAARKGTRAELLEATRVGLAGGEDVC